MSRAIRWGTGHVVPDVAIDVHTADALAVELISFAGRHLGQWNSEIYAGASLFLVSRWDDLSATNAELMAQSRIVLTAADTLHAESAVVQATSERSRLVLVSRTEKLLLNDAAGRFHLLSVPGSS